MDEATIPGIPLEVLVEQDSCAQMMADAMLACRRLSSPEFVRCMMANAAFHDYTVKVLKAVAPVAPIVAAEMTEAQAIAADLYNNVDKAEKAHAAQLSNIARLPAHYRLRA
ncbi:MAG: hypothetical protein JWP27_3045 [Flaviaesturariibacter sp.]|nr:hypothetical protein [Flaviaesturariibacter sp.]